MNFAIDTNRYVDLARNDPHARAMARDAGVIYVPFVVIAELRAGFRAGNQTQRNAAVLDGFLALAKVEVLWADGRTVDLWATLAADLRRAGRPIPQNDLWIAALAVQSDLPLFTRDAHFGFVPGLRCI